MKKEIRANQKNFKWSEGRSPIIKVDKSQKVTKLVYDFCCENGICTICRRRWAVEGRRMCANCTNHNRDYQRVYRQDYRKKERETLVNDGICK